MTDLTIGELFAGYGGLGQAVTRAIGGRVAWVSDVCRFDKDGTAGHHTPCRAPCSILAHRYPDAPNLGDVTRIDWTTVPRVDVLTGGSPCQDVSHAGKRAGMRAGTRSGLWAAMTDAIDVLRPGLVLWENVRGVLSAEADSDLEPCPGCVGDLDDGPVLRALGRVLGDLAGLGYDAAWCGLRAADVGACHGRFRVFVLAWPAADAGHGSGLGQRARPELGTRGSAAADTDVVRHERPRGARDGRRGPADDRSRVLLPTPVVNDMGAAYTPETWDEWTADLKARHGNGNGHGPSLNVEVQRLLPTPQAHDVQGGKTPEQVDAMRARGHGVANLNEVIPHMALMPTPSAADGLGGHERRGGARGDELLLPGVAKQFAQLLPTPTVVDYKASGGGYNGQTNVTLTDAVVRQSDRWGIYGAAIASHEALVGRPAPDPTVPGRKGSPQLNPRFSEWMMGVPDGWVSEVPGITRNEALKALGNGVVPQQGEAAVRYLLQFVPQAVAAATDLAPSATSVRHDPQELTA